VPAWRVDREFDYLVPGEMAGSVAAGSLVRVPFGGRRVRGVVARVGRSAPDRPLEELAALVVPEAVCPPPVLDVMRWVARRYCVPFGAALARSVPGRVRVRPRPVPAGGPGPPPETILRYEGGAALVETLRSGAGGVWVVRALPGSPRGRLVAEIVAARGPGAALVAVPEVRYGSEVIDALEESWPDVARVDSSRSDRDRAEAWLRLATGFDVGAGGRAAVLAPAPHASLVVVDEEDHPSFKETRSPRYDARRVALHRARIEGSACVLISTAPTVESGHAVLTGRARGVAAPRALERAARPAVEFAPRPSDGIVSRLLHRRVTEALREGARAALLAPARGYARALWCASCRRSLRCPRCESGMAFDRGSGPRPARVRCPRCGLTDAPPETCPSCGEREWRFMGAGSERLAQQVARAWPRASVARMDPEVLAEEGPGRREPDVYVTTWVGTKPALRPDVSVVAVLDADALIRRPDFRAAESAYRALVAMAEWAGPASDGGRLLVQCSEPGHHALQAIARADYGFWLRRELGARAELAYPPFSELIALTARGPRRAEIAVDAVRACVAAGARVLGPAPTAPGLGEPALEALVKCVDATEVADGLRGILARVPPGNSLRVDVDPR
jgi:primosomal protein N' (replication factor Y)